MEPSKTQLNRAKPLPLPFFLRIDRRIPTLTAGLLLCLARCPQAGETPPVDTNAPVRVVTEVNRAKGPLDPRGAPQGREPGPRARAPRPSWRTLPPADLEAKLKLMRERLEAQRAFLLRRQALGILTSNEQYRLDRIEEVRRRFEAGGPLTRPARPRTSRKQASPSKRD